METFHWCLKQGEKGKKHKGLHEAEPNTQLARKHITKARHNFETAVNNKKQAPDWSISMYFYTAYHCLLAILRQLGYESRNQTCTIACIDFYIQKGLQFDKENIAWIKKTSEQVEKDTKGLREEYQYGIEIDVSKELLDATEQKTKEFIYKTEVLINQLQKNNITRKDFKKK